ncbi:MAG: hypothetical protein U1E17_19580 [Geminicoccaceae bacterium]
MTRERYPGERRGLGSFLEDLQPEAERQLGGDTLLMHAIRRALRTRDLEHLRHARTLFNRLPREQRHELWNAVVAQSASGGPPKDELLERYAARPTAAFVSFEVTPGSGEPHDTVMALTHELLPSTALRVMVSPGTLPRTAADGLRRIAALIEQDRRLLSERHWRARAAAAELEGGAAGQAEREPG